MRLCVFCGSGLGNAAAFLEPVGALGHLLADEGIGLVDGGARVGLMGVLADAVLARGGEVIGVIPRALVQREIAHPTLTELRVVENMHERKATMAVAWLSPTDRGRCAPAAQLVLDAIHARGWIR